MKYNEIVHHLAARGHDWHYYYENFRYLRQNEPSAFLLGAMHPLGILDAITATHI